MIAQPVPAPLPPEAANPQAGAHPGYRTALWLVAGLFLVLVVGSFTTAVTDKLAVIGLADAAGIVVTAMVAGATYLVLRAFHHRHKERRHRDLVIAGIVLAVALAIWMLMTAVLYTNFNYVGALLALPFTAFALWVLRRLDRNQKEPWRLVLVTIGWGGIVAVNLAFVSEVAFDRIFGGGLIPGPGQGLFSAFTAALLEELPKGAAVVLLFLVMRDQFDDVVDGIIYGALVGLGFNFVESLGYMSNALIGQLWTRQVVGLFTGHVTYTALIGAGLGLARQQPVPWRKAAAIASGFLAAIGAHFLWDAIAFEGVFPHLDNGVANLFLMLPLAALLIDGPWTVALLVLLYQGLRLEGRQLTTQMQAEAATGLGAIQPDEVAVLASPRERRRQRKLIKARGGRRRRQWLRRVQEAQLALAMERWHRARKEIAEPLAAEDVLRRRVLEIKAADPANQARPAGPTPAVAPP